MRRLVLFAACALLALGSAQAANTPCSGKKGGVAHCAGPRFVCQDGSISASKRVCEAGDAPARQGLLQPPSGQAAAGCSCRSGLVCTGPRGGRYCLSDTGRKNYLRQ